MIGHLAGNLQLFAGREMINRYAPFPAVQMSQEAFGHCTNIGECEAVCPKQIKIETIARMNRDYLKASWTARHKQKFRNDEPIKEPKAGEEGEDPDRLRSARQPRSGRRPASAV